MRLSRFETSSLKLFSLCCFVTLAGCSSGPAIPQTVPVKGTVTFDGEPLESASVTLIGSDKTARNGVGTTDASGAFEIMTYFDPTHLLKGVPAGEYRVTVVKMGDSDEAVSPVQKPAKLEDMGAAQSTTIQKMVATTKGTQKSALPSKYSSPKDSGLKAIVTTGMDPLVFELKSK